MRTGVRPELLLNNQLDMLLELWLPADPRSVAEGRKTAIRTCAEAGISEQACEGLDLALGEALANAVRHAPCLEYPDESECHVCIGMWDYKDHLILMVANTGPGVDPPAPPYQMPVPSEEALGGRGLPLMQTLTDALILCRGDREEGGTATYLIKRIDGDRWTNRAA
jgi:anti-sigma regulatory factor (Ser/Thr protein kinase)